MMAGEKTIPIDESYWVIPGRFRAGEYPGSNKDEDAGRKIHWLLEQQTNVFVDLTEEGESGLKPYAHLLSVDATNTSYSAVHKRIALRDRSTPEIEKMIEILDTIDLALSLGRNIYLHCYGGKGRTGTVVGCYLVRNGMSGTDALDRIHNLRMDIPGSNEQSPETEGQKRMIIEWKQGQ